MQCVLLVGDSFLIDEKVKILIKKIEKDYSAEIAQQVFRLSDASLAPILTQARTLPFLAGAQVFRVKGAEVLKKGDVELLETYLANPSKTTYFFFEAESLEKSHGLFKLLQSQGEIHLLEDHEKKSAASRFIQEKLKQAGKTIAPAALLRIQEDVGDQPAFLESVIERLILFAGEESQVSELMVETFHEDFRQLNVFKLTDAIAGGQTENGLGLLTGWLEETDNDFPGLVGVLHWQIRRLWIGKVLMEQGAGESVLIKKCKISPKQMPFFMRQVRFFSRKKLELALEGLFQLDWKIKTGGTVGRAALENWLIQTTQ